MGRALTLSVQQQQPSIQPCTAQLSPDRCRKATVHTERAIGRDNTSAVYLKQLTSPPCGANQSEKKRTHQNNKGKEKGEREKAIFLSGAHPETLSRQENLFLFGSRSCGFAPCGQHSPKVCVPSSNPQSWVAGTASLQQRRLRDARPLH